MAADAIITYVSPTRNSRFDLRAHRRLLRSRLRRATPTVGVADPNRADANGNCWDNKGNQQTCNKGVAKAAEAEAEAAEAEAEVEADAAAAVAADAPVPPKVGAARFALVAVPYDRPLCRHRLRGGRRR